ncbi:MAG: O-antigen ligase family protein [Candidatus Moraniibacteriota bacterium]
MILDASVDSPRFHAQGFLLEASFACLLLTFVLFPIAHYSVFGFPLYWAEGALLCSIGLLLLSHPSALRVRLPENYSAEKGFFLGMTLFLSGIVLSYILNPHSLSGWGEIKSFYVLPALFLIMILVWGETLARLKVMAVAWMLGIFAAAVASLIAASLGWYLYDGRLAGLYQSPNYLAMLLAPGVLIGLHLFQFSLEGGKKRLALLVGLSAIGMTLWLTRSYAAWCALGAGLLTFFWLGRKGSRFSTGVMLMLILFASVALFQESRSEKWQTLVSISDHSSLASRLMIWRSGIQMAADSFPWGIGTGRFQEVYLQYQRYYPPYLEWAVPTPHNLYLHFLLEGGLLTFLGWFMCIGWLLILTWRSLFRQTADSTGFVVLGASLLVFYLAYALVDTPYMKNDLALAVWGSFGLLLAALRLRA